jgi:putative hemolysin
LELLLLLLLFALSAFFSGSETAYFSLRSTDLAQLRSMERTVGKRTAALLERAHGLLSALLIGNLLANTAASVVATGLCLRWFGPRGLAVAVPVLTIALLLFGEITPKMLALRWRLRVAMAVQRPLAFWVALMRPVQMILASFIDLLLRVLPFERTGSRALSAAELQTACDLAIEEGVLSETEGRFLARLLLLRDLEVREVMVPRTEVVTLGADIDWRQLTATARRARYSRYLVVDEEGGLPIGTVHLKDLLQHSAAAAPLAGPLRPVTFVPESKDVAALLTEMRTGRTHLAAVVDEHGDFTGIVTLDDCVRAFMGAMGESALMDGSVFRVGEGRWVVSGRLDLRALREEVGCALPPARDYVTVAGFVMAKLGHIPAPGESVDYEDTRLTVLEMTGHRIDTLLVRRVAREEEVPA